MDSDAADPRGPDVDVIVVGAGISGISAAYHLQTLCPDRTYEVLEARSSLGGTWDLFRYPGVRSDSDMQTLGFGFRPWTGHTAIADGPDILDYLKATTAEFGIDRHIRLGHRLVAARWSSDTARWTLDVEHEGHIITRSCSLLMMCSGYYSYRRGHRPDFPGEHRFTGPVIHPQDWPTDLDVSGQRVVVIGSGATAITLVPALAQQGAHVTMLQRSPTYVVSRPRHDKLARILGRVLPERLAHRITRAKNVRFQQFVYERSRRDPERVRTHLLEGVRDAIGDVVDVDTHFSPRYGPWDQRLCLIPDGDLYESLRTGAAEVVTDRIETFTENGIRLESGGELDADIIVTATGLELVTLAEATFEVDGDEVDFSRTWTYRGLAYSDVPNLVSTFGYINASWTLRADLVSRYVCRVLNHMRHSGTDIAVPTLRPDDSDMTPRPWIDDFSAGYLQRVLPQLPRQGDREPWTNPQRYAPERRALLHERVDDGVMRFSRVPAPEHLVAR